MLDVKNNQKKVLPLDYVIDRFGIHARLVDETDASFIVELRTNPKVARFLHHTDSSVEMQKQWIREYKKREREGREFYFVFFMNGERQGLYRIYNIHDDVFTGGSWLFRDDSPIEASIGSVIIGLDTAFETLGFRICDLFDGVHEDNKQVLRFNKKLGAIFNSVKETPEGRFHVGVLTKENYILNREKIIQLIGHNSNE